MSAEPELTEAERVFLTRCALHIAANPGASLEDAGRAILKRDEELWLTLTGGPYHDQRKQAFASEMAAIVYARLNRV